MEVLEIIRTAFILVCFGFLVTIFIFKKQSRKLNLALFYSFLWTVLSLGIINYLCIYTNLWHFKSEQPLLIAIPLDIYFIWIICWSILPVYFFKGKYLILLSLAFLWIDIACMPYFEKVGIIKLGPYWIIGEFIVLIFVFVPGYLWAKFSLTNKYLGWRVRFQVISMGLILFIALPFLLITYQNKPFALSNNPLINQLIFIIALPSLIAVKDLYTIGKGSPFPLDPTKKLVLIGVYAYIKNPIQWSFTLLFIPISIIYGEPLLMIGFVVSIVYTIGISNNQENTDMRKRFKESWLNYKETVPKWRFLWKPINIPKGTIYFKRDCNQCSELKIWFEQRKATNLVLRYADQHPQKIKQVTYTDYLGNNHNSITGLAHAIEHINLCWASLGWLMRIPIINYLLQKIVNGIGFGPLEQCEY